ncbi:DegT/DnrJ/EryC1/StrS family aminotransferase [Blastococcus xanthinilyticus]|uniref:dTDP-4-amino-4,6-dideoxygalactose transaminase n=1 Tax=Blastococcus xanthinilyticus TaxID=1564164 RepID=A0A5S5CR08_9ACTN|nr:DegT/DnrJ/EryC1/StrS family aminotransferase [Blastococcus xanthinilyticus]TYP86321.1 dTDP-4-amino-4,6-dideoxygalactose transaminase [Blastococcus xanthinilyticus]
MSSQPPPVIALGQPTIGEPELRAVEEVFRSGWIAGNGPTGARFAAEFARTAGTRHALPVNNCTAALHLAVSALGAGPGDEVVVADYTFPATGHAVVYAGATPVFADVRADTATVDPAAVEAAVTGRTVGIIAVDAMGQCADYAELQAIADARGLWLVEDAACAAGATYRGRPAGGFGDAACFSFHGRKGITAGEGGALTTDRDVLAAQARKTHAFGIESALSRAGEAGLPIPEFDEIGYNYKLSDIAAAIMLAQLERLPGLVAARQAAAEAYGERLADLDLVTLPVTAPDRTHSWQSYVLTLDPSVDRGAVARELRGGGVQCNFGTYASHLQPVYGSTAPRPVSADLFRRHLAIPMHANLSEADVERVATAVRAAVLASR